MSWKILQADLLEKELQERVETSAYIDPRIARDRSYEAVAKAGEQLTYLAIFSYEVNRDRNLTPVQDRLSLKAAMTANVQPLLVLTNLENGQFSTEIATKIFTNEALQDRVLNQALQIMTEKATLTLTLNTWGQKTGNVMYVSYEKPDKK